MLPAPDDECWCCLARNKRPHCCSCPPPAVAKQLNELVCLPAACQRIFFGKSSNAAETVWVICRQGDCSPNREFVAELFEDVLRRGRCSEVCIRNTIDPTVAAAALEVVRAALDERVVQEREENEEVQRKQLLRKLNPIRYAEIYGNEPVRPKEHFSLRTIYFQRVSMRAAADSSSSATMLKLIEMLEHRMCLLASLIFFGCDFDEDSFSRLVAYLKAEPQVDDDAAWHHKHRTQGSSSHAATELQSPWQEHVNSDTGCLYWYNPDTNESTTIHPGHRRQTKEEKKPGVGQDDENGDDDVDVANPLQRRRAKAIKVLWLRRAGLTSQFVDRLAKGLQHNRNLMQLDLAQNPSIGYKGAAALASCLRFHPRIWHLGLQDCQIHGAGTQALRVLASQKLADAEAEKAKLGQHADPVLLVAGSTVPGKDTVNSTDRKKAAVKGADSGKSDSKTGGKLKSLTKSIMLANSFLTEAKNSQNRQDLPEIAPASHFRVVVGTEQQPIVLGGHPVSCARDERKLRKLEADEKRTREEQRRSPPDKVETGLAGSELLAELQENHFQQTLMGITKESSFKSRPPHAKFSKPEKHSSTVEDQVQGVSVGVVIQTRKKVAPTTGNLASSLMPWQRIKTAPIGITVGVKSSLAQKQKHEDQQTALAISDDDESPSQSSTDEREEKLGGVELALKYEKLDQKSLWGGGAIQLTRIETLDSGLSRSLQVPRNSPSYRPPRHLAERSIDDEQIAFDQQEQRQESEWADWSGGGGNRSPYGRPRAYVLSQKEIKSHAKSRMTIKDQKSETAFRRCLAVEEVSSVLPRNDSDDEKHEREGEEKLESNQASDPVRLSFKELQRKSTISVDSMNLKPETKGGILKEKSDVSFPC